MTARKAAKIFFYGPGREPRLNFRTYLVLLTPGLILALVIWFLLPSDQEEAGAGARSAAVSGAADAAPTRSGSPGEYKLHEPSSCLAALQRLWLKVDQGRTGTFDLDPSALTFRETDHKKLILALWAHYRGDRTVTDRATALSRTFLLERPKIFATVLRYMLISFEGEPPETLNQETWICAFDGATPLTRLSDGTYQCPRREEMTHLEPVANTGLHMLFDYMHIPRPGDMAWLEQALEMGPGQVVADIGAGIGAYTWPLARLVGAGGKVYALELEADLVEYLAYMANGLDLPNVKAVKNKETDLMLPRGSLDMALIVDIGFCTDKPEDFFKQDLTKSIRDALKPGGRLVILRLDEQKVPHGRYVKILAPYGFSLEVRDFDPDENRERLAFRRK